MLTTQKLRSYHKKHAKEIRHRLKTFKVNGDRWSDKELFVELCFCICTPQSKAVKVAEVIKKDNAFKLMNLSHPELAALLRRNTRFHNNKARHIIAARKFIPDIRSLSKDPMIAREYLVRNIKGLGYKEAGHFLRNIGYRDICIIDRHVVNLMNELKVFESNKTPSSPRKYLEMEQQIKDYAKKTGIDVDELDLALWSIKTGYVFR